MTTYEQRAIICIHALRKYIILEHTSFQNHCDLDIKKKQAYQFFQLIPSNVIDGVASFRCEKDIVR